MLVYMLEKFEKLKTAFRDAVDCSGGNYIKKIKGTRLQVAGSDVYPAILPRIVIMAKTAATAATKDSTTAIQTGTAIPSAAAFAASAADAAVAADEAALSAEDLAELAAETALCAADTAL